MSERSETTRCIKALYKYSSFPLSYYYYYYYYYTITYLTLPYTLPYLTGDCTHIGCSRRRDHIKFWPNALPVYRGLACIL